MLSLDFDFSSTAEFVVGALLVALIFTALLA